MERVSINTRDLILSAIYAPVNNPKALVQIIHGMVEQKNRYIEFIQFLNENGYSVIISDNRGHGLSVNDSFPLGHIGNPETLIADQFAVTNYIKGKNPGVPLYMFAHSMGSLIARNYIMNHDNEIEKLTLSGTVAYLPMASVGVSIASHKKPEGHSKLLWAFSNNCSFKEDLSWLSYNQDNINAYLNDPLCGFKFTNLSNKTLFTMVQNLSRIKKYEYKNHDLKILSLSGKDDRTTSGTRGLEKTLDYLKRVGYEVTFKEYDNMKHEILNEKNHIIVFEDVVKFFDTGSVK